MVPKICLDCKDLNNQTVSGRPKTVDIEAMLQPIEVNPANSTWRISGELVILKSSMVCHFHDLSKSIWIYCIGPYITKILENFSFTWALSGFETCIIFLVFTYVYIQLTTINGFHIHVFLYVS